MLHDFSNVGRDIQSTFQRNGVAVVTSLLFLDLCFCKSVIKGSYLIWASQRSHGGRGERKKKEDTLRCPRITASLLRQTPNNPGDFTGWSKG